VLDLVGSLRVLEPTLIVLSGGVELVTGTPVPVPAGKHLDQMLR
jgi:hypothetical protein